MQEAVEVEAKVFVTRKKKKKKPITQKLYKRTKTQPKKKKGS
jgi:hypothetical protein